MKSAVLLSLPIAAILILTSRAVADQNDFLKGRCSPKSHIAEGAIGDDLTKRQSRFFCDAAVITHFSDNPKHVMVQFLESKSTHARPIAYAGMLEDARTMQARSIYLEPGKQTPVTEGSCTFFYKGESISQIVCGAKVDEAGRRTVPIVAFDVDLADMGKAKTRSEPPAAKSNKTNSDFDRIFEYTLFDKTLPDGKHPVWVYFQSGGDIIRVEMPSMDMCLVTRQSSADLGVINSKNYDEIPKSSKNWSFAQEIWKAAFQRHLIVGKPRAC